MLTSLVELDQQVAHVETRGTPHLPPIMTRTLLLISLVTLIVKLSGEFQYRLRRNTIDRPSAVNNHLVRGLSLILLPLCLINLSHLTALLLGLSSLEIPLRLMEFNSQEVTWAAEGDLRSISHPDPLCMKTLLRAMVEDMLRRAMEEVLILRGMI